MKYRIVKHQSKTISNQYDSKLEKQVTKVNTNIWYIASRKGRIFGFWHAIGHEYDFTGDLIRHSTKTIEEMEEYIKAYHEVNYGDGYKYEIIKEIDL